MLALNEFVWLLAEDVEHLVSVEWEERNRGWRAA